MIVVVIINSFVAVMMAMVIYGLRPFWRDEKSPDLQYLAVGLSWLAGTAGARAAWALTTVATGLDIRVNFAVGTVVGGVYLLRSYREMIPRHERHRWPSIIAAFYPRHPGDSDFADTIRRWWCRNQR